MIVKILLLTVLLGLASTAIIRPIVQDQSAILPSPLGIIGGYSVRTASEIQKLEKNIDYRQLVLQVRRFWKEKMNQNLSSLYKLETKIVAGTNYRFTFTTTTKPSTEVIITVFSQPWSNTRLVKFTIPQIPGGIQDGNLNKFNSKNL